LFRRVDSNAIYPAQPRKREAMSLQQKTGP